MAAPRPVWQARAHEGTARVLWGRCNSEPAVKVRDPAAASSRLTRWNSWTDGQSPDGKSCAARRRTGALRRAATTSPPRVRAGREGRPPMQAGQRQHAERVAMRRALELAQSPDAPRGPNPRVGCVMLDADGATVAE